MKKLAKKVATIMLSSLLAISLTAGLSTAEEKLVVQDNASNDVFKVDDTGRLSAKRVGAGTENPAASFHLFDQGSAFDRGLIIQQANDDNAASVVSIKRSRGTETVPTSVAAGDNIVGFHGQVYDGTSWIVPASFMYVVDGPVSTGSVPGAMIFKTGTINPTPERMRISSNGSITMGSLAGSGNAYACVDASGKLYRSSTPCN
jgi:hypothetical protein